MIHDWQSTTIHTVTVNQQQLACKKCSRLSRFSYIHTYTTPTVVSLPRLPTSQIPVPAYTHGVLGILGYHDGYWDTMMDTGLLDCLFEIDSQQQDWGEEGCEENGEEICQAIIATTETHAAGEISTLFLTPYTFFSFLCYADHPLPHLYCNHCHSFDHSVSSQTLSSHGFVCSGVLKQ